MKKLKFVLALLAVLTLAATLAVGVAPAQGKRDLAKMQARLEREIRHEILTLPYYGVFDWLGYKLNGDQVTLVGQVTRPLLKNEAEKALRSIEGVAKVRNEIEVLPLSSNDDRIRRAVFRELYSMNSPLFRYGIGSLKAIHIIVNRGHVTLVGTVDSEADKTFAGTRASSVPGVFSVTNNLKVGE